MERKYTELLHVTHPILFRANYGFAGGRGAPECNNGWLEVIDRTCYALENLLEMYAIPEESWPYITQIKEKFGLMRFYTSGMVGDMLTLGTTEEMQKLFDIFYAIINEQENATAHICERCGSVDGKSRSSGWVQVLCDTCEQWRQDTNNDFRLRDAAYAIPNEYGESRIAELRKLSAHAE